MSSPHQHIGASESENGSEPSMFFFNAFWEFSVVSVCFLRVCSSMVRMTKTETWILASILQQLSCMTKGKSSKAFGIIGKCMLVEHRRKCLD